MCRKAVQWLKARGVAFEERAIRETPPGEAELRAMLAAQGGQRRLLFNTSGLDYRALGLKDTLPGMGDEEALRLLAGNGNLIKRPFAIDSSRGVALVGFQEDTWARAIG